MLLNIYLGRSFMEPCIQGVGVVCRVGDVRVPLGSGSAGRVTNSQPESSTSSISKQSAVSTRAERADALHDSAAAPAGTGTEMSCSPPAHAQPRSCIILPTTHDFPKHAGRHSSNISSGINNFLQFTSTWLVMHFKVSIVHIVC